MARLVRTQVEMEGRYEERWTLVEEDAAPEYADGERLNVVGHPHPRVSAAARLSGSARFISDISLQGMVHAAVLRSPHANARVASLDLAAAAALPGVRAAIGPGDIPDRDGRPVLTDTPAYAGAAVAAVAADTPDAAERALAALAPAWEPLAFVVDLDEGLARQEFTQDPGETTRGDVDTALAAAAAVVDLTNRCNMMCDPCFMDANQVGYVHELSWEEIQEILDNALMIKPRRQMSVQFSGGEPTMHPYFLDAVRYARKIGYNSVQAATNGIEFAKSKEFSRKAFEAGMRYAYLQFDGIGNDANSHRQVGNLFDVKLRAIENMHEAGIEIVLVTTIVNNVNNDQVGPIVKFAMDNPKKIAFVSFQPVSFTGRDEDITPERRIHQRYTLSHLAQDVSNQVGQIEPTRDWFPLSLVSVFAGFSDLSHGPDSQWGSLSCGCHPNCGVGTAIMINKNTKEWAPVPRFLDAPQLVKDVTAITDAARNKKFSNFMMAMALLKNYKPFQAPPSLTLKDLWMKFDKTWALSKDSEKKYGRTNPNRTYEDAVKRRESDPWNFLFLAGMWFQDLFNYDFRRTEMCIIPYATQQGEISFCAYNTGIGWRKIIENMYKNATVAQWYKNHGKHEIYAKGKKVDLANYEHSLRIDAEDASRVRHLDDAIPQAEVGRGSHSPQTGHGRGCQGSRPRFTRSWCSGSLPKLLSRLAR